MLRLRNLRLTVNTDDGQFGANCRFTNGINVIRAGNSAGKSTLLQAIIYALGLEGMLSASHDVPLPHAVTDYLEYEGGRANVIDSMVTLEIENRQGHFLTLQRSIAGERHRHLITVHEGRAISAGSNAGNQQDYFVREPRSATSERGFHKRLADFLGWSLPQAPRFNESDCPLYLETIFPLLYVEQKLGWGRLPARYPTWFGIRDISRRTVEFLLGLDAYATANERAAVQDEIARVRAQWASLRERTNKLSSLAAGIPNGIPPEPISAWPPEVSPRITIPSTKDWIGMPALLERLRERLSSLQAQPVPSASSDSRRADEELSAVQRQLADREMRVTALVEKIEADTTELASLERRIEAIDDDLRKYKDVRRLRQLGSADQPEAAKGVCPTCHQDLVDSLLETGRTTIPMSVEQNVTFYEEQLKLFTAVRVNAQNALRASQMQLQGERTEVENLRSRVRELRETLVSPANMPSVEAVGERIRIEDRIANLEAVSENFEDSLGEFAQLSTEWKEIQLRRSRLPKGALSQSDENKVNTFEGFFRDQLVRYGMDSLDPRELTISRDDYEPVSAGINLGADVSASDLIRLQWAFLLGLLQLGLTVPTNHPGLLVMDEPQQQSVEEADFRAMLEYANKFQNAQILVATSHDRSSFSGFLEGLAVNICEYGGDRVIRRI